MKKSGRILIAAYLGEEYGFVDINGELKNRIASDIFVKISSWIRLFGMKIALLLNI